jgi:hypothetical protein
MYSEYSTCILKLLIACMLQVCHNLFDMQMLVSMDARIVPEFIAAELLQCPYPDNTYGEGRIYINAVRLIIL